MQSKVLIIDDDAMIREVFTLALKQHGYAAVQAANGKQGLATARTNSPSLILLDLDMPGISGWETMELLQADETTAGIPVVLATSCEVLPALVRKAGFRGYLQKPVTLSMFIDHIRSWIGHSTENDHHLSANPRTLLPPLF